MGGHDAGALESTFQFVHKHMDSSAIKEKVDKMGIHGFINYCAGLAATTGALAGAGGGMTLALGLPADVANTVAQQFRVTLAVVYHRTGRHNVNFGELMKIGALSLGVEIGTRGLEYMTLKVAQALSKRLTARIPCRLIPFAGAIIGGGLNFAFIKALGGTLLALEEESFSA